MLLWICTLVLAVVQMKELLSDPEKLAALTAAAAAAPAAGGAAAEKKEEAKKVTSYSTSVCVVSRSRFVDWSMMTSLLDGRV